MTPLGHDRILSRIMSDAEFPQSDLTREVIGAFFDVYNYFRPGYLEAVYAGGMAIELRERGIAFVREARLEVRYKGRVAGIYRPDFLVENHLVLELKACAVAGALDRRQLLNYLRVTHVPLGLLLHFGTEPQVLRVVNRYPQNENCAAP
jgi:GxxExxY protein